MSILTKCTRSAVQDIQKWEDENFFCRIEKSESIGFMKKYCESCFRCPYKIKIPKSKIITCDLLLKEECESF